MGVSSFASESWKAMPGINPASLGTGATNGTGIDTVGFNQALLVLAVGAMGSSGTMDVKVQESSDNGVSDTWADVTGAVFTQLVDGTHDNTAHIASLDLSATERYIRIVSTGGTAASPGSVTVLLGDPDVGPVTQTYSTGFTA